jgi:CRP/FNR family cyclic AMP-dependent transcriptional regulator
MRKALYILGDLDDHDLVWMSANGEVIELYGGETLIHAGTPVSNLYFVTEGALIVSAPQGDAVAKLGVGDVIGEMSFVEKRPPDVSVVAEGPCRLLRITRESLLDEFSRNTSFSARFYRALAVFLSDRLRTATAGSGTGDLAIDNELDEGLLDTLHVAGDRMRRLIDVLERRERS